MQQRVGKDQRSFFLNTLFPTIFSTFLEGLCQVLYDTLRPLVIHLHHLETLSELTAILRSEMIGHHCANHPPQLQAFEKIASQLLQDVQERLVYRAYIYIRTDILGKPDDIFVKTDILGTN